MLARLRRWQREQGDTRALALVRVGLGLFLASQAVRQALELRATYFGDRFHLPFLPEAWVAPRSLYVALVAAQLVVAAMAVLGAWARPALLVGALLGLYVLLCDRLQFHHNRYTLLLFSGLLAFSPCDRYFAVRCGDERTGLLWAQRLSQLQLAIIYVASGGSKLLDPDWRSGVVISDRITRFAAIPLSAGIPHAVVELFCAPTVASVVAKLAIATELLLAVALFRPRLRACALWWGMMFHLTIEITSKVEIFTWLTLTLYLLFITPDVRAREIRFDPERHDLVAVVVRTLDWLGRFTLTPVPGAPLVVLDRDGTCATGLEGLVLLTRALPIAFPLWLPLAALAKLKARCSKR
jgi:hypothetical protein